MSEEKIDIGKFQKEFLASAKGTSMPEEVETEEQETVEQPEEQPKEQSEEQPAAPVESQKPTKPSESTESALDEYWGQFVEMGFEVPDYIKTGKGPDGKPLTKQQKLDALREAIFDTSQLGATEDDDLFVRQYLMESSKEGFDRKKWLKEQTESADLMTLPSKDFMRQVLKQQAKDNNYEWTDEDIEAKLNGMSKIDLDTQASQYKARLKAYNEATESKRKEQELQKNKGKIEETNKALKNEVNGWLNKNKDKRKLGGFEFDDAEAEELHSELADFVTKKEVTLNDGTKGFFSQADMVHASLLRNDENAMRFLIYLYLIDKGKLDGFMSEKLEQKKRQIEETLADSPEDSTGGLSGNAGFDKRAFLKAAKSKR